MFKWITDWFNVPKDYFFQLQNNKNYTTKELLEILKSENISLGTGNSIMWVILKRLEERVETIENELFLRENQNV